VGPEDLDQILKDLPIPKDPRVLVGLETSDDAGVYRLTDEIALVQTVDFFTPIVDDPFVFGQVAAANALSDVYAMGGKPLTAMNLVAFPVKTLPISILKEILTGGLSKASEAGVALVGGHTVEDPELKYGMSVTGIVHPDQILSNSKALPRDQLVLTKPIGTGVVSTALKGGMASEEAIRRMVETMVALNRLASEQMRAFGAHACTDITGFGFIGHALEMAAASRVGMVIRSEDIRILPGALDYAKMGLIPGGAYSNRTFCSCKVEVGAEVSPLLVDLLYDPQTSGGLLIAVPFGNGKNLVESLLMEGILDASVVGEVVDGPPGRLKIL
jgi:selenide, water dikinase